MKAWLWMWDEEDPGPDYVIVLLELSPNHFVGFQENGGVTFNQMILRDIHPELRPDIAEYWERVA